MRERSGEHAADGRAIKVLWRGLANRRVATLWSIGGIVTVDTEGIHFEPNRVERALRSRGMHISASDIESFDLRPGLFDNVFVDLASGKTERFKATEPSAMLEALRTLGAGGARRSSRSHGDDLA